jgi:osmotically-inducible protein OsmY
VRFSGKGTCDWASWHFTVFHNWAGAAEFACKQEWLDVPICHRRAEATKMKHATNLTHFHPGACSMTTTISQTPVEVDSKPTALSPSKDAIQMAAQQQLEASPYRELQGVSCFHHNGEMQLRGRVSSFYLKQMAQTIVRSVTGVEHIVNGIHVKSKLDSASSKDPSEA